MSKKKLKKRIKKLQRKNKELKEECDIYVDFYLSVIRSVVLYIPDDEIDEDIKHARKENDLEETGAAFNKTLSEIRSYQWGPQWP